MRGLGADLLVHLYELRLGEPYRAAAAWLESHFHAGTWAEIEARHPAGSRERNLLRTVLDHWELVGALADAGGIDLSLLFDSTGEFLGVWSKVEPWIDDARKHLGDPTLCENLELLVSRFASWQARHPPKLARRAELIP